jgi:hypothetical protein
MKRRAHWLQQTALLLDHFVGDGEDRWRHLDVEHSRSFGIDD